MLQAIVAHVLPSAWLVFGVGIRLAAALRRAWHMAVEKGGITFADLPTPPRRSTEKLTSQFLGTFAFNSVVLVVWTMYKRSFG